MIDARDFNLQKYNTFGISETCRRFIAVETADELQNILPSLSAEQCPLLIIGGGSNLLLTQRFEGTVIRSEIRGMEVSERGNEVFLRCGSGECWDDVVAYSVEHGWYGAENLSIIPGDVGASAVQNIGAYGREAKDIISTVDAIELSTGRSVTFDVSECCYGYRESNFKGIWKGRYFITYVTYRLSKDFTPYTTYGNIQGELHRRGISTPTASDVRDVVIAIRRQKLPEPAEWGNAGSFFMNPIVERGIFQKIQEDYPDVPHYPVSAEREKIPAGWLIERCGWKGKTLGRAGVYEKQALVLINCGGATGSDIVALSDAIRRDVRDRFHIDILPEVNIV